MNIERLPLCRLGHREPSRFARSGAIGDGWNSAKGKPGPKPLILAGQTSVTPWAHNASMAVCEDCRQEMTQKLGCIKNPVVALDGVFDPIVFGSERRFPKAIQFCGDCGAPRGGFHHRGCDMEQCPRCRRQLLSCGCDIESWDESVVEELGWLDI
jgi:hypothetical protein